MVDGKVNQWVLTLPENKQNDTQVTERRRNVLQET